MKKKGLIISTVVMVVVLIASLTTATYAWFSSQAMAKISSLNVQTVASTGLTIAATGTGGAVTSGTMTPTSGVWVGANDGFGDTLEFTSAFGGDTVYGCSGDGTYLVTAANEAGVNNGDGAVVSGKPVKVVNAEKNAQYFELDLAIQTTEDLASDKDLVLKTFTVTADGAMAAASRIAFYTSAAEGTDGEAGYTAQGKKSTFGLAADKLVNVLMAEPFANSKYSNGTWASTGTVTTPLAYKQAEAAATDFLQANVTKNITGTGYVYVGGSAYFNGAADTNVETFNVADKVLGTFAQNSPLDTVYLRLVIWFEGEDAECVAAWAGTGITVNMEFEYKA